MILIINNIIRIIIIRNNRRWSQYSSRTVVTRTVQQGYNYTGYSIPLLYNQGNLYYPRLIHFSKWTWGGWLGDVYLPARKLLFHQVGNNQVKLEWVNNLYHRCRMLDRTEGTGARDIRFAARIGEKEHSPKTKSPSPSPSPSLGSLEESPQVRALYGITRPRVTI